MPKVYKRSLSYGETQNIKCLAELEAKRKKKLRPGYQPNANSIFRPSQGPYGALQQWSDDNV